MSLAVWAQGFGLSISLICAIGAQNAYVLRAGLKRQFVFTLASICFLSDSALIALGCGGFGALVQAHPVLIRAVTWVGAAFLIVYGARSLRAALRGSSLDTDAQEAVPDYRRAILTCFAVTWLNPHVYLDTVLLLGGIAGRYADGDRLAFAAGAMCASGVWFFSLGFGAAWLAPLFRKPATWRVLDALIAATMWTIAASLLRGLAG